mgnify:CR=1 FL=1
MKNKNLKICQWFLDPIGKKGPDYLKNNKRVIEKVDFVDSTFLTSSPSALSKEIKNSYDLIDIMNINAIYLFIKILFEFIKLFNG